MERLPTRRDLERLAAWSELHRADSLLRAAKRMRKVVLTIKVSQPGAAGKATARLK